MQQRNCNIKSNKCHFSLTAKLQCSKNSQLKLLRQKRTVDSLIILHDLFVSYFDNCKDKRPVVTTVSWWNCQRRRTWHSQTFLPGIFTFLENIQGNSAAPALFGIALNPRCMPANCAFKENDTLCISPVCWRDFPLVNSPAKEMVSSLLLAFLTRKSLSTYSETLLGSLLLAKAKKLLSLCVHLSRHCSIT